MCVYRERERYIYIYVYILFFKGLTMSSGCSTRKNDMEAVKNNPGKIILVLPCSPRVSTGPHSEAPMPRLVWTFLVLC